MKTILNTSRRKKIRTRKSLNEIRKRSRRLNYPEKIPKGTIDEMGNQKNNHFITTNRLTLQMFPNAIQSETVTRFGNEVKTKLNLDIKKFMPIRESFNVNAGIDENIKFGNCENINHNNSDDDQHKSDIIDLESPELSSGLNRESDVAQSAVHAMHETSPLSDTTDTHCTDDEYYLYEQFMSKMSEYLKRTVATSLFREDVIDNLKAELLSLKIQPRNNIQFKHKATISEMHITNVSEDLVVEDPMDYIRLSYSAMQNSPDHQSDCSTGTSTSIDSLRHMHSPQVLGSSSRTDISDTPEYIYFPHKLN